MGRILLGIFFISCYLQAQSFYAGALYNNAQIETTTSSDTQSSSNSSFYGVSFGYISEYKDRIEWLIMQDSKETQQLITDLSYKFTTQFGESLPYGKIGLSNVILDGAIETTTAVVGMGIISPLSKDIELEFGGDFKNYYFEETDADAQMVSLFLQVNYKF